LIYIIKRRRPRMLPCGTPEGIVPFITREFGVYRHNLFSIGEIGFEPYVWNE